MSQGIGKAKKINHLLKTKASYTVTASLWIEYEGERCFGLGRMELLQRIEATGSINKAAKEMGMSYKKAWEMINQLNKQTIGPLVVSQSGGEQGGGSIISKEAKELIIYYKDQIYSLLSNISCSLTIESCKQFESNLFSASLSPGFLSG